MLIVRAIGIWLVLAAVMVANGAARNLFLTPHLGEQTAHQLGSVSGALLIVLVTAANLRTFGAVGRRELLQIGLLWLAITVTFEFLFGRFVAGQSWRHLVAEYDLSSGRLWVLVLATTLFAPLVAARFREALQVPRKPIPRSRANLLESPRKTENDTPVATTGGGTSGPRRPRSFRAVAPGRLRQGTP